MLRETVSLVVLLALESNDDGIVESHHSRPSEIYFSRANAYVHIDVFDLLR